MGRTELGGKRGKDAERLEGWLLERHLAQRRLRGSERLVEGWLLERHQTGVAKAGLSSSLLCGQDNHRRSNAAPVEVLCYFK